MHADGVRMSRRMRREVAVCCDLLTTPGQMLFSGGTMTQKISISTCLRT